MYSIFVNYDKCQDCIDYKIICYKCSKKLGGSSFFKFRKTSRYTIIADINKIVLQQIDSVDILTMFGMVDGFIRSANITHHSLNGTIKYDLLNAMIKEYNILEKKHIVLLNIISKNFNNPYVVKYIYTTMDIYGAKNSNKRVSISFKSHNPEAFEFEYFRKIYPSPVYYNN